MILGWTGGLVSFPCLVITVSLKMSLSYDWSRREHIRTGSDVYIIIGKRWDEPTQGTWRNLSPSPSKDVHLPKQFGLCNV